MVTTVFWVAVFCSFINFLLVLFVFPESLDKVKREQATLGFHGKANGKGKARDDEEEEEEEVVGEGSGVGNNEMRTQRRRKSGIIRGFLRPLAVFLPVVVLEGGVRKRRDWSLTFLGAALFGLMLSNVSVLCFWNLQTSHRDGWNRVSTKSNIYMRGMFMNGAQSSSVIISPSCQVLGRCPCCSCFPVNL
jgi:hypothetical protein